MLHPALKDNIEKVIDLCKKHRVTRLHAFGSVTSPQFNDESDIDLLVSFDKEYFEGYADNYFDLEEKLINLLHRKVDIVSEATLSNPYFIDSLNKSKQLIYG